MIHKPTKESAAAGRHLRADENLARRRNGASGAPLVTIFTVLRPAAHFGEQHHVAQSNAIRSWARLAPHVEILLLAEQDEPWLQEVARSSDAQLELLPRAASGPPPLDHVFRCAHERARGSLLMFSNADMIFTPSLPEVAHRLLDDSPGTFLAIGQRTDLAVGDEITGENLERWNSIEQDARNAGRLGSLVCKDYFLFTRDLYRKIPPFRIGRGNWDNWMVWSARRQGIPVVDLTDELLAIHQVHGYGHLPGGRREAYVSGEDARFNRKLAGGRHLWSGSCSDWELTDSGVTRKSRRIRRRLADVPRFLRLLRDLLFAG